jgi:hypothetical protein
MAAAVPMNMRVTDLIRPLPQIGDLPQPKLLRCTLYAFRRA